MLDVHSSLAEKRVRDCMTSPVATVGPDDSARTAAEVMLRLHISGAPVVDRDGRPLGVVSESDFRFSDMATREKQREAFVKILSGGQDMAADYLDVLERQSETVQQIMAKPAICVDEAASIIEAADLMNDRRIKRLLVLRGGVVVGVVTRADLLRFFAPQKHVALPVTPEFFQTAIQEAEGGEKAKDGKPAAVTATVAPDVTAAELQNLVAEFERNKSRMHAEAGKQAGETRREQVKLLLKTPYSDHEFAHLLTLAREAARRGEASVPALVFPAALCIDGGRAINLPDPEWPATLQGKAADFFLRWDKQMRPLGFKLSARIVSFPDGFPGDAELALFWGR
jgi:CBS domain-containing protein